MLKRQIMLLKTTTQFYQLILKILAKKLVFSIFVPTVSGIASVSHPSLIISRAPKHEAKIYKGVEKLKRQLVLPNNTV